MRIQIDAATREPVSEQLSRQLRSAIERGSLAPGERLPTIRQLAAKLGLAANTVAKAYRSLEGDGLLEGKGRHGTYVSERLPDRPPDAERRLTEAADGLVARARQLGFGDAATSRAVQRALRARRS